MHTLFNFKNNFLEFSKYGNNENITINNIISEKLNEYNLNIESEIYILDILDNNEIIASFIISNFILNYKIFLENKLYNIKIFKFNTEFSTEVNIKYPLGTYDISFNEFIDYIPLRNDLSQIIENDINHFDIINNNEVNSLNNILIPDDVNPINFYFMIAHYKIILIFDHSTDNIFIFQNSILESFLALHLPNSTFNLIFSDENSFYEIYEINIYEYINDSYKNKEIISLNLQKLGEFNNNEINNDEYELYFWVENFDVKITDKIKKYIDSLFENILINVSGYCKDDLNNISNNEFLDFTSNLCLYSTINNTTINNNENYINWTSISDWENFNNQENLLKISLNGTGYLKISKQRLKKILNIDIESNLSGIIENDKFNLLNINQPQITPFERLQNILSIKNI